MAVSQPLLHFFKIMVIDPYMVLCAIWYHSYNFKNLKNTHGGVLLLACNFTKSNTPPWVFFTFFKLYKWYQIAQRTTIIQKDNCVFFGLFRGYYDSLDSFYYTFQLTGGQTLIF